MAVAEGAFAAARLRAFLDRATEQRFAWGEWDCLLFVADWLLAAGHADAAAPWRAKYSTAAGACRILARSGGVVALLEKSFEPLALVRTGEPQPGDVAAVKALDEHAAEVLVGAVRTGGGRWAVVSTRGLKVGRPEAVAIWSASLGKV